MQRNSAYPPPYSAQTAPSLRLLVLRAADYRCALPLSQVVETLRPLPCEPLADMPDYVRGLTLLRGHASVVVDAARLLGAPALSTPKRFVALKTTPRVVCLAVDDVLGVHDMPATELAGLPPLLQNQGSHWLAHLGVLDSQLLLVLQAARLLPPGVLDRLAEEPTC